jgi:hypothetical protein
VHSGRNAGFDALLVAYKNGRQGAVIMMNRNNNGGFVDEILDSVAREYNWSDYLPQTSQLEYAPVPSSIQRSYAGVYTAPDQSPVTVIFEDEKLFARAGDDAWLRLYPASESEFFTTQNATRWTFTRNADGRIEEIVARAGAIEVRRRLAR